MFFRPTTAEGRQAYAADRSYPPQQFPTTVAYAPAYGDPQFPGPSLAFYPYTQYPDQATRWPSGPFYGAPLPQQQPPWLGTYVPTQADNRPSSPHLRAQTAGMLPEQPREYTPPIQVGLPPILNILDIDPPALRSWTASKKPIFNYSRASVKSIIDYMLQGNIGKNEIAELAKVDLDVVTRWCKRSQDKLNKRQDCTQRSKAMSELTRQLGLPLDEVKLPLFERLNLNIEPPEHIGWTAEGRLIFQYSASARQAILRNPFCDKKSSGALARFLGVSRVRISNWRRGTNSVGLNNLDDNQAIGVREQQAPTTEEHRRLLDTLDTLGIDAPKLKGWNTAGAPILQYNSASVKKIIEYMNENELIDNQIAKLVMVNPKTVYNWKRGKRYKTIQPEGNGTDSNKPEEKKLLAIQLSVTLDPVESPDLTKLDLHISQPIHAGWTPEGKVIFRYSRTDWLAICVNNKCRSLEPGALAKLLKTPINTTQVWFRHSKGPSEESSSNPSSGAEPPGKKQKRGVNAHMLGAVGIFSAATTIPNVNGYPTVVDGQDYQP